MMSITTSSSNVHLSKLSAQGINKVRLLLIHQKRLMGFSVPNKPTDKCIEIAKNSPEWNSNPSITTTVLTCIIGIFTGGLGSLVGLGGSIFAVPILTTAFRMPQSIANGTSMAAVVATAGGSVFCAIQNSSTTSSSIPHDSISWDHVPKLIGDVHVLNAICISLTASVMANYGARMSKAMTPKQLKMAFGTFLLTVGPLVPLKNYLKAISNNNNDNNSDIDTTTYSNSNNNKATLIDIVEPLALGKINISK